MFCLLRELIFAIGENWLLLLEINFWFFLEIPIKFSFDFFVYVLAVGIQVTQHADEKYAYQLIIGTAKY